MILYYEYCIKDKLPHKKPQPQILGPFLQAELKTIQDYTGTFQVKTLILQRYKVFPFGEVNYTQRFYIMCLQLYQYI